MALFLNSRFQFGYSKLDPEGREYLTEHVPFHFRQENDNRTHMVQEGDNLFNLAGRYLRGVDSDRACGLWWILADFNDIHDPTIQLQTGSHLAIPSTRLVRMEILAERRRREQ